MARRCSFGPDSISMSPLGRRADSTPRSRPPSLFSVCIAVSVALDELILPTRCHCRGAPGGSSSGGDSTQQPSPFVLDLLGESSRTPEARSSTWRSGAVGMCGWLASGQCYERSIRGCVRARVAVPTGRDRRRTASSCGGDAEARPAAERRRGVTSAAVVVGNPVGAI